MIRSWLLLVCALTSCAPTPREGWLTDVARRSQGLCWWRHARWEDRGTLLVRGTGEPFAHARVRWAGEVWRGASTSAVLRRAGPLVVLQGEWSGPGLTLTADVDVSAQAVFRAYEPARLGSAGLLLKGGHVRVRDALVGRALVVPAEEALRSFQPEQSVALEVGCDALSLLAPVQSPGDEARQQLVLSGFPATAPERWVPQHLRLPASAAPGGGTIGHFVATTAPLRGFLVDQRAEEARLVVPTPAGVVWVGWVPQAGLEAPRGAPPEPRSAPEPPLLLLGSEWRSCQDQELPVSVESRGKRVAVGTLKAATPFLLGARQNDLREAQLGVEWLDLEPEVRLLLPAGAIDCPRLKQLGGW